MKITDVTLTLFAWDDIPATTYGRHTGKFGGKSQLGLLTLRTDEGAEGHAFLGSASAARTTTAESLIAALKPARDGPGPARPGAPVPGPAVAEPADHAARHRRRGRGAVGPRGQDRGAAHPPAARLLPRPRRPPTRARRCSPSKQAYAEEAARFKSEGWTAYKIHPPTDPELDIEICEAVRGDGGRRLHRSCSTPRGPTTTRRRSAWAGRSRRWASTGTRTRWPTTTSTTTSSSSSSSRSRSSPPSTSPGGFTAYAPWLVARATDYLRGDVAVKGGISALVKTAHLAEGFHMNFEIHHGGNSLNNVANLHVTMAIRNCEFFEVLLPAEAQKYGLVARTSRWTRTASCGRRARPASGPRSTSR